MLTEVTKDKQRGVRMQKSLRARTARKSIKNMRELRILSEWAKNRRIRKKSK